MKRIHKRSWCLIFGLAAAASAPAAAAEFVAVDAASVFNTLRPFDTNNPFGARPPVAILEGTFNRGIDLTHGLNGYYISMMPQNGSPTGLYELRDGTPFKVGDVPFQTTALGGLTLSRNYDRLYAALVPPGKPCTLFEIELSGEFHEIGPIIVAGSGSSTIAGLAVDPQNGTLYGLDNQSDALVTIDPNTGAARKVGDGLGVNAEFGGGMDFALDNTGLYMLTRGVQIYHVNTSTGAAGPLLGSLPFGTEAIAAIPEPTSLLLISLAPIVLRRRK